MFLVYVCLFICLLLLSVSAFITVWARTFEVAYPENSFLDFDINLNKVFAQQAQRYTDTHRYTHMDTHTYTKHTQLKKSNFLLFGIVIVFRLWTLCLADSYVRSSVCLAQSCAQSKRILRYVWTNNYFGWYTCNYSSLNSGEVFL